MNEEVPNREEVLDRLSLLEEDAVPETKKLLKMDVPFAFQHQSEHLISPGDSLILAIAEAVAVKLERMTGMRQRLMDVDDAATYLGMTAHALRHKAGIDIPCVRIDGKLRFDRLDLDRVVDSAKREGV